ncbi:hypothetical protein D3C85_1074780 [compost metagenome]
MTKTHLAIGAALLISGCASMAEGTVDASREVLLTSTPAGAAVTQGDRRICTTPCKARQGQLRYAEPFTFTFVDGRTMTVDPKMEANGAVLGNIIFGGIGGAAIDALTGRLVMNSRHVHAEAAPAPMAAGAD